MHLAYLESFKGADTLLLAGEPAEVERLAKVVEDFAFARAATLNLRDCVPLAGECDLWISRRPMSDSHRFNWLVDAMTADKIRAIARAAPAHQYIGLVGSTVQLLVSAGEYASEWWQTHA